MFYFQPAKADAYFRFKLNKNLIVSFFFLYIER